MKVFLLALLCIGYAAADTATGDHQADTTAFGKWRACMASKIPSEKRPIMDNCVKRPGGSDMAKFRRGLGCVLDSYGIVVNNRQVDLAKMSSAAGSVTSPELKKAFEDCSKDERNAVRNRTIKCVIDHLETACPAP